MSSLLVALGLAVIWMFLCALAAEFAARRGHSPTLWYLFSLFFTPLLGFFIVGVLPSSADLVPAGYRRCLTCGALVPLPASTCPCCHAHLSTSEKQKLAA